MLAELLEVQLQTDIGPCSVMTVEELSEEMTFLFIFGLAKPDVDGSACRAVEALLQCADSLQLGEMDIDLVVIDAQRIRHLIDVERPAGSPLGASRTD